MKKIYVLVTLLSISAFILTSCGAGDTGAEDLYADIMARGYVVVSTDPNYEPQSFLNVEGVRPADTLCPSDLLTTAEMQGFDVDVAIEIGERLGVEVCFATPDWDLITAGSWADKWDMSVGSMTIKPPRPDVLYFTTPYYAPTAVIAVHEDSAFTSHADLVGATICVGTATTYEDWLNGILDLDPKDIYVQPPEGVTVVSLPTDQECPQAIAAGRTEFEAYATSITVVAANIAAGMPVKEIGGSIFREPNAVSFDKSSTLDPMSLVNAVDQIILDMHADNTLSELSIEWFGYDLTQELVE